MNTMSLRLAEDPSTGSGLGIFAMAGLERAEDDDKRRDAARTFLILEAPNLVEMVADEGSKRRLGDLHDRIARSVMKRYRGRRVECPDGYQMLFERPDHAVSFALAYFRSLDMLSQGGTVALLSSVGIHHGTEAGGRDIAAKLASVATGGQILLTQEALDLARSGLEDADQVRWLAHGSCEIEGLPTPVEVFEAFVEDPAFEGSETLPDVQRILHEALDLDPDERRSFLAQACRGELELLREVESLLRADEQAGDFLERPFLEGRISSPPDSPQEDRMPSSTIFSGVASPNESLLLSWLLSHYAAEDGVTRRSRPRRKRRRLKGRFAARQVVAGRYRIVALLGRGGMGEVYRAEDLKLGEPVALKFLPEPLGRDVEMRSRFLHEVKIARHISHPNVCRVYDVGEMRGHLFLSMEYINGEDLDSILKEVGPPGMTETLAIIRQVCHGLAAAHHQEVLHRDLKPANLMIDHLGRARITDFGLAGLAGSISGAEARHGTPAYMAPEQHAGREISVQTDLYALGLVTYELLTGRRPFEAESPSEIARLHRTTAPLSPSDLVAELDPAVERMILHCLEKKPEDRPASVKAVMEVLRNVAVQG